MITKEMIENGFKNNLISLEDEFGGAPACVVELVIMHFILLDIVIVS